MESEEKRYQQLLGKLGISTGLEIKKITNNLEEIHTNALELFDVISSRGDQDEIAAQNGHINEIEWAIEYTAKLMQISSGLVIHQADDNASIEALRQTDTNDDYQVLSVSQNNVTLPSSVSNSIAASPQPKYYNIFRRAKMELEDENWDQAVRLFDKVLDEDADNVDANIGMFMAKHRIRERNMIPQAAWDAEKKKLDLFSDSYFKRAVNNADSKQKIEFENYITGKKYLSAVEKMQRAKSEADFREVYILFYQLKDFADSEQKKDECELKRKDIIYNKISTKIANENDENHLIEYKKKLLEIKEHRDASKLINEIDYIIAKQKLSNARCENDYLFAADLFKDLDNYKDAKIQLEICNNTMNYVQQLNQFEKDFFDLHEVGCLEKTICKMLRKKETIEMKIKKKQKFKYLEWVDFLLLLTVIINGLILLFIEKIDNSSFAYNKEIIYLGPIFIGLCLFFYLKDEFGIRISYIVGILSGFLTVYIYGFLYLHFKKLLTFMGLCLCIYAIVSIKNNFDIMYYSNKHKKIASHLNYEFKNIYDLIKCEHKKIFNNYKNMFGIKFDNSFDEKLFDKFKNNVFSG